MDRVLANPNSNYFAVPDMVIDAVNAELKKRNAPNRITNKRTGHSAEVLANRDQMDVEEVRTTPQAEGSTIPPPIPVTQETTATNESTFQRWKEQVLSKYQS